MANYKLVDADQLDADLKTVADAIREKGGTTDELAFPDGMASAVEAIQAGGGDGNADALIGRSIDKITSEASVVGKYAFSNCLNLTGVNLPYANALGDYAFDTCRTLKEFSAPLVGSVGQYCFIRCDELTNIELPNVNSVSQYAFSTCSTLKTADLGSPKSLPTYLFIWDYSLIALILRGNTLCTASTTNVLHGCSHFHGTVNATYNPDGLKDGYIYVPRALVDSYKTATNWTTFADQFRALEDYTVDGTTTGEMDWDKINGGAS